MEQSSFKPEYFNEYFAIGSTRTSHTFKEKLLPSSYLDFAKFDLSDGQEDRNLINAVGNAKRAFHFQVESVSQVFGWDKVYGNKNIGFPKRLEFLASCGVLSPNILKKLNRKRNDIEHDYFVPNFDEVEDYIDIVELFLMATRDFLVNYPEHVEFELMEDEHYDKALALPKIISVEMAMYKGELVISAKDLSISRVIKDKDYFDWLSAVIVQMYL
ncbi:MULTISPECIES: hypothetical protein [Vibrio]|uniref:hypothetical protein n=1 Tax=Vibrio TaxID=662 RepID=UPI0013026CFE|nr:hypothetical protein [Vibrio fluvialis]